MSDSSGRMPLIDAFKAVASQLIVFHHFSAYGPLLGGRPPAGAGHDRLALRLRADGGPGLSGDRRLPRRTRAVAERPGVAGSPLPLIGKRYLRLVIPFLAAIALAILCAALARPWLNDEMIPAPPTVGQLLAHALLLQSLLDFDSLSAGLWYIAIDFQLFALLAILLWLGRYTGRRPDPGAGAGDRSLCSGSTATQSLDNWALYFFGSYGLGAAAWWAGESASRPAGWLVIIACVTIAALAFDFRLRIALALAVALLLGFSRRSGLLESWPQSTVLAFLGRISYAVFLVHFPIYLLANALFVHFGLTTPGAALLTILAAWTASIAVATLFHRWIEGPAASRRIAGAFGRMLGKAPG